MAGSSRYTEGQLELYFERIGLPVHRRIFDISDSSPDEQLRYLAEIQTYQLISVPFENLSLHYSWHRKLNLNAESLFDKIVLHSRRGGYCMENNTLFHVVLRSLGFKAYMVGARVYGARSPGFGFMGHCLNIVNIGGQEFGVDVCFGARVPIYPFALTDGLIQDNLPPGQLRLRYDTIPEKISGQKLWIFETRKDASSSWSPCYAFEGVELLAQDFAILNLGPETSPDSFFTYRIILVRFTAHYETYSGDITQDVTSHARENNGEPPVLDGQLILDGELVKWRKNGVTRWEITLQTEEDRVQALKTWFGIILSEADQHAIHGTVAALEQTSEDV
jgi:arylamine N-acetyltransferase